MLEFYEIAKPMPCFTIYYMGMKSPWPFANRDFVSKRIVFRLDDVYYLFYTAMPEQVSYYVGIILVPGKEEGL